MIDQIKKVIIENKGKLNLGDFSFDQIKISKFFHGNSAVSTKILFFISIKNKPECLIKMVRGSENNDLIMREAEGIKYFESMGFKTPKLFFAGELSGLKYICQEIAEGHPVGKTGESEVFSFIAGYHNSVFKTKTIKIQYILDILKNMDIKGDKEYNQTINLLSQRGNNDLYLAPQHGDLTYKNIIKNGRSIVFIDFENFGLRSVWGIDITHYLTRMVNANNEKREVLDTLPYFVESTRKYREKYNLKISDKDSEDLFLVDLLFEILQKNLFYRRKEIISLMKNIWLK